MMKQIYFLMPVFYTNEKKSNIERDTGALISLLEPIPEDEYLEKINQFRKNSDITVMLSNGSNTDDGKERCQLYNNDPDENGKEFYIDSNKNGISINTSLGQDNIVVDRTFTSVQNNIYHIKTVIPLEAVNEAQAAENTQSIGGQFYISGMNDSTTDSSLTPLDELDVSIGWITIIEITAISLFLASATGFASILKITKYEPIKILMERN